MDKEIKFKGHFDPNKQVISIDGDGASVIKFTADATQLAEVIRSLAIFKENLLEIRIRKAYRKKEKWQEPGDLKHL